MFACQECEAAAYNRQPDGNIVRCRQREGGRGREGERGRDTTDTQTHRHTQTHTDIHRHTDTNTDTHRHTDTLSHSLTNQTTPQSKLVTGVENNKHGKALSEGWKRDFATTLQTIRSSFGQKPKKEREKEEKPQNQKTAKKRQAAKQQHPSFLPLLGLVACMGGDGDGDGDGAVLVMDGKREKRKEGRKEGRKVD